MGRPLRVLFEVKSMTDQNQASMANKLLAALPAADFDAVAHDLESVELPREPFSPSRMSWWNMSIS